MPHTTIATPSAVNPQANGRDADMNLCGLEKTERASISGPLPGLQSIAARSANADAMGEITAENSVTAAVSIRGGPHSPPCAARFNVAAPKIINGVYRGSATSAIKRPPRRTPAARAAPIEPMKKKPADPMADTITTSQDTSGGPSSMIHMIGAITASGIPVAIQ